MRLLAFIAAASLSLGFAVGAPAEEEKETKVALDQVPKAALDAVKEEFPGAKLTAAESAEDDGETYFEIELTHEGHSIDVSVSEDGTIEEVEKEIAVADLPKAVTDAIQAKYPQAKIEEAEELTEYEEEEESDDDQKGSDDADEKDDADEEDGEVSYEVEIVTADGKSLELEVSADGKEVEGEDATDDKEEPEDE